MAPSVDRRQLLHHLGGGLGMLGAASMLAQQSGAAETATSAVRRGAAFRTEGQTRYSPVHERWSVSG